MIAFIDTEVGYQSKQAKDYGAVRDDGAVLHTHSLDEFQRFLSGCEYICGHNIINFDLKYTLLKGNFVFIDTLTLSPLLFPSKPYHRLVKDDKLQVDELNNPVNDAKKARDLFYDEVEAWGKLSQQRKEIRITQLREEMVRKGLRQPEPQRTTLQPRHPQPENEGPDIPQA